jgi:hypothetical protein
LEVKLIRADVNQTLAPGAYSKAQIARWVQRFEQGGSSCKDELKPERPLLSLGQLSPDSSRNIHSKVHELLQPTSELLAIRWKSILQENSAPTVIKAMAVISAHWGREKVPSRVFSRPFPNSWRPPGAAIRWNSNWSWILVSIFDSVRFHVRFLPRCNDSHDQTR